MTPLELLARFRADVNDEETPYLWSDTEVFSYLVSAQDEFARRIGGILDSSETDITDIAVTDGDPWATYNPLILKVRDGYMVTAGNAVRIINYADVRAGHYADSDYGMYAKLDVDSLEEGIVRYAVLGMDEGKLRLIKVPAANDTLRLKQVYRLPYPRMADWEDTLEIHEQHHIHLLKWMKHEAYSKKDSETRDDKLAREYEEAFAAYCARAQTERERRHSRTGVVQYGGI